MREGDMKFLKSRQQFLFNVVEDPLERANLKQPTARSISTAWFRTTRTWNATMLPEDPAPTAASRPTMWATTSATSTPHPSGGGGR